MYVFEYLTFNFKLYGNEEVKNLEKRKVRSHDKVRSLFVKNKVRFARAEQLWR